MLVWGHYSGGAPVVKQQRASTFDSRGVNLMKRSLTVQMVVIAGWATLATTVWAQVPVQPDVVNEVPAGLAPGIGARAAAMGDAYVALATDTSALYWNPAGLARLSRPEADLHNGVREVSEVIPARIG